MDDPLDSTNIEGRPPVVPYHDDEYGFVGVPVLPGSNNILVPPYTGQEGSRQSKSGAFIPEPEEDSSACCSGLFAGALLAWGLIMFLIFITISSVLGQDPKAFCDGYWLLSPDSKVQLSGHSTVAVWGLIMGTTWLFLGVFAVLEVFAASRGMISLRDQLRTVLLLHTLFLIAWIITGNAWIIGDFSSFGVIPNECKDGLNGNRNLYHFCLAMLIFFDIIVPIFLFAAILATTDVNAKTVLNKTFLGPPAPAVVPPTAQSSMQNLRQEAAPPASMACCTFPIAAGSLVFGLVLFLIFVTIAGALGQDENAFCNGYWKADPKFQLGNHSIIAVWALMQGSAFFFCGFLWVLEYLAAAMRAIALRDRIRTILLLTVMFTLAWMIAGNVWVIGDLNNLGKIPDDCKNGLMGNRNLYHFCLSILVIMDVLIPIGMFAAFASTYDEKSRSICNRPLFLNRQDVLLRSGKLPSFARKTWPCCTIPVTIFSFVIFTVVFAIFAVVPNVLEPGSTRRPWDATFCNGYWLANPKYQLSGHSTAAVWALLQGSAIFLLGVLWILENLAASINARAFRDQIRTLILMTLLLSFCWLICGNVWILGDETGHSSLGVIPQDCKSGNMGDRRLYHFCQAMVIILDITFPLALLAAASASGLNKTLAFIDGPAAIAAEAAAKEFRSKPPAPMPTSNARYPHYAETVFIGEA